MSASYGAVDDAFIQCLSARLKRTRQMRRKTLKAVADAAACSESLLSKFENGKNFPSLPMLGRIAQALDVTMSFLLSDEDDKGAAFIHRGGPSPSGSGLDVSVDVERVMVDAGVLTSQCSILNIAPGEAGAVDPCHEGEETGIVLEGHPSLVINGCAHLLDVGDAFAFRADQPHGYHNVGSTRARIFRFFTPSALAA